MIAAVRVAATRACGDGAKTHLSQLLARLAVPKSATLNWFKKSVCADASTVSVTSARERISSKSISTGACARKLARVLASARSPVSNPPAPPPRASSARQHPTSAAAAPFASPPSEAGRGLLNSSLAPNWMMAWRSSALAGIWRQLTRTRVAQPP